MKISKYVALVLCTWTACFSSDYPNLELLISDLRLTLSPSERNRILTSNFFSSYFETPHRSSHFEGAFKEFEDADILSDLRSFSHIVNSELKLRELSSRSIGERVWLYESVRYLKKTNLHKIYPSNEERGFGFVDVISHLKKDSKEGRCPFKIKVIGNINESWRLNRSSAYDFIDDICSINEYYPNVYLSYPHLILEFQVSGKAPGDFFESEN